MVAFKHTTLDPNGMRSLVIQRVTVGNTIYAPCLNQITTLCQHIILLRFVNPTLGCSRFLHKTVPGITFLAMAIQMSIDNTRKSIRNTDVSSLFPAFSNQESMISEPGSSIQLSQQKDIKNLCSLNYSDTNSDLEKSCLLTRSSLKKGCLHPSLLLYFLMPVMYKTPET